MSFPLSAWLSVKVCVRPSTALFVHFSFSLSFFSFPTFRPFVLFSVRLSAWLSVYLSTCLSVRPPIRPCSYFSFRLIVRPLARLRTPSGLRGRPQGSSLPCPTYIGSYTYRINFPVVSIESIKNQVKPAQKDQISIRNGSRADT